MKSFSFCYHHLALIVSGKLDWSQKPSVTSWLIDGTNLQCCGAASHGGGRMERDTIIEELQQIASPPILSSNDTPPTPSATTTSMLTKKQRKQTPTISNVVLVFDGNEDEDFQELITEQWFQVIITDGKERRKDRADDYIVHHALPRLHQRFHHDDNLDERTSRSSSHRTVVHLVSADKELRKRATATRMMNGGSLVYPPKFWKQYVPNLQQQQQQQLYQSQHDS